MIANKKISVGANMIDWARVDAAPMADVPDDESPELSTEPLRQLKPIDQVLPELTIWANSA